MIYKISLNEEGKFGNAIMSLLFYLKSEEDISNWHNIKTLKSPLGFNDIDFYFNSPRETYINKLFEKLKLESSLNRSSLLVTSDNPKGRNAVKKINIQSWHMQTW